MHEKVTKLRALLSQAQDRTAELDARRAFARYAANDDRAFYVDPAPRARMVREVLRIATSYGWAQEVERALDAAETMSLTSLSDLDLAALLARMRQLEDCARNGLDSPDSPVAR